MQHTLLGMLSVFLCFAHVANAAEYLVRFHRQVPVTDRRAAFEKTHGGKLEAVSETGNLFKWTTTAATRETMPTEDVAYVSPNRTIRLPENPSLTALRRQLQSLSSESDTGLVDLLPRMMRTNDTTIQDNPSFLPPIVAGVGPDPRLPDCWGIFMIGADQAYTRQNQGKGIIVAVTDTGVDYNHEDLIANIWRNPGEIEDGVDNDGNGLVDDMVGWDFASNDNKPYDLTVSPMQIVLQGGNPGHGTHVSGVIAASHDNSVGVSGVAPQAQIMAMRFMDEKGQGSTENAVKAIDYAIKMGAKIISASWGSEKDDKEDKPLQEAIGRAQAAGVLFVAAAGNGREGVGYDNDNDPSPTVPASFTNDNMVTVAAIDSQEALAPFSNWGAKTTHIGAPGVKILSTTPGNNYQDTVIDMGDFKATWDGTSMATPFVSGSLAVVWSQNPSASYSEVKAKVLSSAKPIPALAGKVVSGGRLDLK